MFEETSPDRIDNTVPPSEEVCRELVEELCDMAGWLAGEGINPDEFRKTLVTLESRKLARFGFRLSSGLSTSSRNPLVHLSLRTAETGELCASVNVNPRTGEFFIQQACA